MSVFVLMMNNIFLRIKLFSIKFNIFLRIKLFSIKFIDKYLYPVRREDGNDKHNDRIYENYGYDYNYEEDEDNDDSNSIENVSLISA